MCALFWYPSSVEGGEGRAFTEGAPGPKERLGEGGDVCVGYGGPEGGRSQNEKSKDTDPYPKYPW